MSEPSQPRIILDIWFRLPVDSEATRSCYLPVLYALKVKSRRNQAKGQGTMTETGKRIINLDRRRMTAMAQMDVAAVRGFLSDELIYTHTTARIDTKASLIESMVSRAYVYDTMEPFDVGAQDFGNVVVLTGSARIHLTWNDKPYAITVRFTDVWANNSETWQMVAFQSTTKPE